MTKIKNTKKGMAKKTLSMSLVVAMLATSNVPVWAAEFSDGTEAAFTSEAEAPVAEAETPAVEEEVAAPVVEDNTEDVNVATEAGARYDFSELKYTKDPAWGTNLQLFTGSIKDEKGKNKRIKPIDFWKVIEKDVSFGTKYTLTNNKGEKFKTSASGITMRKASEFQDKLRKELEKLKQKLEEEKKRLAEEAKYVDISKMEPEEQLKKIIEAGMRNIWMVGPAGCGKSTMARNVANELNVPYLCISCGIGTSATEFVGYKYPTRESTKFAEYYAKPSVILIDEMTALDPAVGQVLNAALANGEIETTTGLVCRHPECIIIATSNTFGNGASRQYVANNQLDASTIDRFTGGIIEVNYSVDYESQYDTDVVNYVWKLREIIKECNLRRVASTRMIQSGHLMKKAYFKNWKEMLITNWTDSEKEMVNKELDFSTRFLQTSEIKSEIKKAA